MQISAVLIVKNEQDCLAGCLDSLKNAVDEIIVTDTGSTDETVPIAGRYTSQVSHFVWIDDFAAARNFALEHATGDYILHIDADDVLVASDATRGQLEAFAARYDPSVIGTVAIESSMGPESDAQRSVEIALRFFQRGRFHYEGAIHEQLVPRYGKRRSAPTGLRYIHSGYQFDAQSAKNKAQRNKNILRRVLAREPNDEYYLYQLGKAHFSLQEYADSMRAFEHALERIQFAPGVQPRGHNGAPVAEPVLSELLCSLAYAYVNTGAIAQARTLLERHQTDGHGGTHTADFHHALGYVYLMCGDVSHSKASYTRALQIGASGERVVGTGTFSAEYHLGLLAEAEGDLNSALEHYQRSLVLKPDYTVTLARCVDLIGEYRIALPANLWNLANRDAFQQVYREKLTAAVGQPPEDKAALLVEAAKGLSPDLYRNCAVWLRESANSSP